MANMAARILTCGVVSALLATPAAAQTGVYTHEIGDGSTIKVRIDVNRGGVITDVHIRRGGVYRRNVIDSADWTGRQAQAALYDIPNTDCWPCNNMSCNWNWQPVQAGNACQQYSGGSVLSQTATRIVTTTTPLHWNNLLGRSNVAIEQAVEIVQPYVARIDYDITNNESFAWSSQNVHELPVVYAEHEFSQGFRYDGGSPFTSAPLTQFSPSTGMFSTTEPWVALRDSNNFVIALYVPGKYNNWNVSGWAGDSYYMQAWNALYLNPGQTGRVTAYLVAGNSIEEVRSRIYGLEGH
jgi:hypothetical protein